jgi:pilus assembly protein Flp/PilA
MLTNIKRLMNDDEGATLVEYGLLVALVAAISIGVIQQLGVKIFNAFTATNAAMP